GGMLRLPGAFRPRHGRRHADDRPAAVRLRGHGQPQLPLLNGHMGFRVYFPRRAGSVSDRRSVENNSPVADAPGSPWGIDRVQGRPHPLMVAARPRFGEYSETAISDLLQGGPRPAGVNRSGRLPRPLVELLMRHQLT